MLGFRDPMDETLVNPELKKHAAGRMREEAEIAKERRKAQEEKSLRGGGDSSGGSAYAKAGAKGGKGGKGAPPPEQ